MAQYKEVLHERLYVKVPGTDNLRKGAAARLKHLLANGWRETDRWQKADHVEVRIERVGHAPLKARLPRPVPASENTFRRRRNPQFGGRGGGGRRR